MSNDAEDMLRTRADINNIRDIALAQYREYQQQIDALRQENARLTDALVRAAAKGGAQ